MVTKGIRRTEEGQRGHRARQPVSGRRARRGRQLGGQDRHLPRGTLPTHRPKTWQPDRPSSPSAAPSWSSSGTSCVTPTRTSPAPKKGRRKRSTPMNTMLRIVAGASTWHQRARCGARASTLPGRTRRPTRRPRPLSVLASSEVPAVRAAWTRGGIAGSSGKWSSVSASSRPWGPRGE